MLTSCTSTVNYFLAELTITLPGSASVLIVVSLDNREKIAESILLPCLSMISSMFTSLGTHTLLGFLHD